MSRNEEAGSNCFPGGQEGGVTRFFTGRVFFMKKRTAVIVLLLVVIVLVALGVGIYADWLWFEGLGFGSVFLTVLGTRWGVRLAAGVLFFVFFFFNLYYMRGTLLQALQRLEMREKFAGTVWSSLVTPRGVTLFLLLTGIFMTLLFTSYTGGLWLEARQYFQGVDFQAADPIFGRDVSFYVFQLPFLGSVYSFLQLTVVVTALVVGVTYFFINPPVQVGRRFVLLSQQGLGHLSLLLCLSFLLKAWDYRLQMYELMYSLRGMTFGPGYTDMNANLPALWALLGLALGIAALFIYNIFKRRSHYILWGVGGLIAASIVLGSIYPAFIQHFRVEPNEFAFERPYLEHNIAFTRKAFALDEARSEQYPYQPDLSWDDLELAQGTLDNVRLWDYRPLLQTYNQLQGIRPYYEFQDVDTDRYHLEDGYGQVMLSARELNQARLSEDAQTWVNLRLQYTHGYGLAMSPVATVSPQGLPVFNIKDIPPRAPEGLEVERPELYYGEISSDYVIANTKTPEFSYPEGETNVYVHYEGEGGVPLQGLPRRLLYALYFSDYRIVISNEITADSRIMYHRPVRERVSKAAPFLQYDDDPYLVVAGGRLFWIIDAYTVTDRFPYSEPFGGVNYMRNSVKVVVDAYHGDVSYYVVDPEDPLVKTYSRIFPDLFEPFEEMPEKLVEHIRYPETLLSKQAWVYATYHMTDPVVFYNREDLWEIPNEKYAGVSQPMEPYYNILQLPGEEEPEFMLVQPFTPARRDNMIAWMAGRSDGENYGELLIYYFPSGRHIYGPMQIETRIDQNPLISQQLALWDQRGSRVIRGNLLVLPVEDSVLYVEPVFLQAEDSELPELARVIVGFGDTVVMEPALDTALESIFGPRERIPEELREELEELDPDEMPEVFIPSTIPELARRANELYRQAQERLQEGDWPGYGEALAELEETLQELAEISETAPPVQEELPDELEEELREEEMIDLPDEEDTP